MSDIVNILKDVREYHKVVNEPKQLREIVPPEKWLSPYYLGSFYNYLYDYWKPVLCDIIKNGYTEVVLGGSLGGGKTLDKNTLVPTSMGILTLDELEKVKFEYVSSRYGRGDLVKYHNCGVKESFILKDEFGNEFEGSPEHRFLTLGESGFEFRRFKFFKPGDNIVYKRKEGIWGSRIVEGLSVNDYYALGLIFGDGFISKNRCIYFCTGKKDKSLETFRPFIEEFLGQKKWNEREAEYVIIKQRKEFCSFLVEEGFGRTSKDKDIPLFVRQAPKEYILAFLRGLFDTDGTIKEGRQISLTLKKKEPLRKVQAILFNLGVYSSLKRRITRCNGKEFESYRLRIVGRESLFRYRDGIGFNLPKKKRQLDSYLGRGKKNDREYIPIGVDGIKNIISLVKNLKEYSKRGIRGTTISNLVAVSRGKQKFTYILLENLKLAFPELNFPEWLREIDRERYRFSEVVEIDKGKADMRDLTIYPDETYIANGAISHNSSVGELLILRKIYELSCFENIPALFGLPPTSQIVFMYLSVSVKQSERTGFGRLMRLLDSSPYFREHFPRDTGINSTVKFLNTSQVAVFSGSDIPHFISCLVGSSRVLTNKGLVVIKDLCSGKDLSDITVATRNEDTNEVEYKPIIKAVRSGYADTCAIYCNSRNKLEGTTTHPVATPNGYRRMGDLVPGDLVYKYSESLNEHQEELVRGSILGDSYLKKRTKGLKKTSFVFMQCNPQKEYFELKWKVMEGLCSNRSERKIKSKFDNASSVHEAWTRSSFKIGTIYDELYEKGQKKVTREYLDKLTDRAVFYWYMDDGSCFKYTTKSTERERYSISFHTQGFSLEENYIIRDWFRDRYGLPAEVKFLKPSGERNKIHHLIQIPVTDQSEEFLKIMQRYSYEGCLLYKLIYSESIPVDDQDLKYSYELDVVQKVKSKLHRHKTSVYNLVVEGNSNYVANEYLVHNTDLYLVMLDEANFLKGANSDVGKFGKATAIYRESANRRKGRFTYKEKEYGLSLIVSSADTASSFTESRIEAGVSDPLFYHKSTSILDVKRGDYSKEEFHVMPGYNDFDPFILSEEYKDTVEAFYRACAVPVDHWNFTNPPEEVTQFFLPVPVNFLSTFKVDVANSIKEILGLSIRKRMRLFYSKFNWKKCINPERKHPFKQQSIEVSTSVPENELIELFIPEMLDLSRDYTYFTHIDQSVTGDCTGLSLVHPVMGEMRRFEKVVIDFMIQIHAPKDVSSEIDIEKVRDFILYIKDLYKIRIGYFSYDQYASRESLQHIKKRKIECGLVSVDRDDVPYKEVVHLLNKHQLEMYDYPIFKEEFFNLIHFVEKRKVDHEEGRSKDVSDSVAGGVWTALKSFEEVLKNQAKKDDLEVFLRLNSKSPFLNRVIIDKDETRQRKAEDAFSLQQSMFE